MFDQMEEDLIDLSQETSKVLPWMLLGNNTEILEGKVEHPLRSRTSKGFEEIGCSSSCTFGGLEASEGGL